ncbi:MAG TPA: coproporphyrinogen dehydrogenase HemZ [Limnochordia bacterium]|nr:coproporphyrinogen dehydrogenase HemZ [Limnochordia bacterium]
MEVAVKSLAPNASFGPGKVLQARYAWEDGALVVFVSLEGEEWTYRDTEILDVRYNQADRERRIKERVRLGIRRVFERVYGLAESPWGILTGVRPLKMVHSMLDRGFPPEELREILLEVYALSSRKADLLLEVAARQRPYFHPDPNNPVSIYVGIPFCPTRCSYCSFAAYPLETHGHLLPDFLKALYVEIGQVGSLLRELGLQVEAVYLGGGTPTTVQGDQLEQLLQAIQKYLVTAGTKEFTVEAGRPETLSRETLAILKAGGTQRICINPQTMHEPTLQLIGRRHTVEDVRRAFTLAREVGIPLINMDVIMGLPGEELSHVRSTLEELARLGPDNLTVHSLALKRASRLKKDWERERIAQEQGEAMVELAREYALGWGMSPYYLYRQRHILGDLENVGYAREGTASIYNIQMMEERQSIIALGGGGVTKLVASDLSLVRQANPKCPAAYAAQIREGLGERLEWLRRHFSSRY